MSKKSYISQDYCPKCHVKMTVSKNRMNANCPVCNTSAHCKCNTLFCYNCGKIVYTKEMIKLVLGGAADKLVCIHCKEKYLQDEAIRLYNAEKYADKV